METGEKVRIIKEGDHGFDIGEVVEFTGNYTGSSLDNSFMPVFYSESRSVVRPVSYLCFEPANMKNKRFRVWGNDGTHSFELNDIVCHTGEYASDFSSAKYKRESDGLEQFVARRDLNFIMGFSEKDKEFIRQQILRPKKEREGDKNEN